MGSGGWSRLGWAAIVVGCATTQAVPTSPLSPPAPPHAASSSAPRIASTVPPGSKWTNGADANRADANRADASRPAGVCFSDSGCPGTAAPLPACAADVKATDLGAIGNDLSRYLGQTVVISGRLLAQNDTGNELVQCQGCCAPRRTPLRLVPHQGQAPALGLIEPSNPRGFGCLADASQLCCDFDLVTGRDGAEARVAAFGKLVEQASEPQLLALQAPQLCSLEGSADPNSCSWRGARFEDGVSVSVRASCLQRRCEQGSWVWHGEPCATRPTLLQFQPGFSELDADQRQLLEKTAQSRLAQQSALAISAHSASTEGAASAELSRKRLAFVKRLLLAAGIAEARLRIQSESGPAETSDPAASPASVELRILSVNEPHRR